MSDKILKTLNGYTIYDEEARTRITSIEKDYASTDYVDEAVSQPVNALADGKVDKNQGTENNGKFLGVVDGYLVLVDAPSGTSGTTDVVRCVAQELTEEQQEQVRANIGAASMTEFSALSEEKVDQTQLINAVNNALTEAKESGEFDGAKGDKGDTGEQGVQGEKGETGATGEKGADGTSVTVSSVSESPEDGGSNIVTFSDGTKLTVKNGSKGSQGEKGEQGIQGIQGDKGDKGDTGETGANGKDYVLTEADKEEIARMIDEVLILTEAELEALTQEELAEKYEKGTKILIVKENENLVRSAINPSGEIYNGCGYLSGYRLNSSGGFTESEHAAMTGFIPYTYGKEIHINGGLRIADVGGNYINTYNKNFELISCFYLNAAIVNSGGTSVFDDKNMRHDIIKTSGFTNSTYVNAFNSASYIRVSLNPCIGKDMRVSYI